MNCGIHNKSARTTSLLKPIDLSQAEYHEKFLQELINGSPHLLPFDEIDSGLDTEFFSFGREIRTKAGPIDNLLGDSRGEIVIVETKLWRNPESRRKVVAQIFDYMKELTKWNFEQLDSVVRNATKKSI
jgi:RecB family endonuclease NucS